MEKPHSFWQKIIELLTGREIYLVDKGGDHIIDVINLAGSKLSGFNGEDPEELINYIITLKHASTRYLRRVGKDWADCN